MSDNRPARYEEDGKIIYRASSLMMCDRMFIALSENYTPNAHPEWFQEVLDEGTRSEQAIIDMYQERNNLLVTGQQLSVELEVMDDVFIRGHIDGMVGHSHNINLFEAKKFRESTWGKFLRNGVECMPWYPWQTSVYMHALDLSECDFVGGLYKDNQIETIHVHHLASPPIPLKGIVKRVAYLEALVNGGKRVNDVPCSVRMYPCPFFYLHEEDDTDVPPTRPADDTVKALITEREQIKQRTKQLQDEAKIHEARVKELNRGIEAWLKAANLDDDERTLIDMGDGVKYEAKYHTAHNKGYTVQPFDYTTVTVKPVKQDAKSKAKSKRKTQGDEDAE